MKEPNRDPSIHITESRLRKILEDMFADINLNNLPNHHELANELLLRAKKHSLSHRNLLVSNDRQAKQAEKVTKASLDNTMVMAKVIYQVRKSMRHRGIELSKPGSRDWPFIKNITKNAEEFAQEEFKGDPIAQVFQVYIREAMKDLKTFSLAKIQSMHSMILENYDARQLINTNDNLNLTERAFKEYNRLIIEQVGTLLTDYSKDPREYKHFIEVAQECKKLKITPEDYIKSQFEGLAWTNGIPTPKQLIGPKASERLQKYLFENKISLGVSTQINQDRVNKFKALRGS
jgi:hypothetical protein